ncbi:MAG: hypothetical protein ABI251_04065 [Mycobacteriaceae bacterium]
MIRLALRAELRKLMSTKLWWILLIPAVLVTYVISVLGAAIARLPDNETLRQLGGRFPSLLGVSVTYSVAFTSLLILCLGINAAAGEFRQRTITTTYLTTRGRGTVLTAKLTVLAALGLGYGIAVTISATLGGLTVGGWSAFPPVEEFLAVTIIGAVVLVLWALVGVGVGTLLTNHVVALLGALAVRVVVENLAGLLLRRVGAEGVADVLPGAASSGAIRGLAINFAIEQAPLRSQANFEDFLPASSISWWASGFVFGLWVLACCLGAWLVAARRDVP